MKNRLIISGLCLLCLLFARCADPFAKEEFVAYDEQPIGLYLETVPEYSNWVKLLKKADLFNAVNISLKYTCFVANNQAVDRYLQAKNPAWKTVDDLTEEEASNLMKYHIVVGADYNYLALSGKLGTLTASGDYLTGSMSEDGSIRYINSVEVLAAKKDKKLINGYVQELKDMLDPIIYTVMEVLEQHPEYSIMTQAFKECGLDAYLGRKEIMVNNTKIRDYKTIVIGSDSAFHAKGIYTIEDLKAKFPGEPTNTSSEFYKFVAYHVFSKSMDYADLTSFGLGVKGMNIETYAAREFVTVIQDLKNDVYLNPTGEDTLIFVPQKYDTPASNGYIHEVSGIMPVVEPVRYPMVWEPTDIDACRALPFYRTPKVKNVDPEENHYFKPEDLTTVRWKTIPYKEKVLAYVNIDVDWDRFMNDDHFRAELGSVGWVEFDTPVLMRGKYNIKMEKWLWYESKGEFQFYIDNEKFGTVWMGQDGGTKDFGIFQFRDSGSHKFRFNVLSVVTGSGQFYVDRFTFTPVD